MINNEKLDKVYNTLVPHIKGILFVSEGWLIGGAVASLLKGKQPNDYDIIIPNRELFLKTVGMLQIHENSVNNYGGMKFKIKDEVIDIWCEELDHFISTANKFEYAYKHKNRILLEGYK